ncbi:TPA: DEAD/DEAH box helicase [Providencia rettgeri]|nr:DEAD/DEAH box helicase [Providencia rettgeri]
MIMKDLPLWLINNSGFNCKFKMLTIKSVVEQFPKIESNANFNNVQSDISYLLTCGSILAHSDNEICQDAALRISQYCLLNDVNETKKDSAALILDTLSNNATLNLAIRNGLIKKGFSERLPIFGQWECIKRKIEHTIELGKDKFIYANRFQSDFWDAAKNNEWVSISAPTSVGKSYILESWVEDFICKNDKGLVIYLVPTRALISEVYDNLTSRFEALNIKNLNIQTLPLKYFYDESKSNIFVFTQERLNIFYNHLNPDKSIDLLIVDEAHKISDSLRGIYLQHILELVCSRNKKLKVIFASPFTENPEILLSDAPYKAKTHVIKSNYVTVNQNLIWIEQKANSSKLWSAFLIFRDEKINIGDINLDNSPAQVSKRLSFIALALGRHVSGNIVYVNGAADAEKTAKQIADGLPEINNDEDINNLIELSKKIIHVRFSLNIILRKGVAFHYGNMPIIIKSEIERLFSNGKIQYLVCTSTLVEGVNMACKNIFIRGPKKGNKQPMKPEDFWNLAGRAGRWGKEFQGNVICIDTNDEKIWNGSAPKNKKNIKIERATDNLTNQVDNILEYINSEFHYGSSRANMALQGLFSYLCISYYLNDGLVYNPYMEKYSLDRLDEIEKEIDNVFQYLEFPSEIISRNPGISPILMQNLWERFCERNDDNLEGLLLSDPSSDDALSSYMAAFTRIKDTMSTALGHNNKGIFICALLVINWMKGHPLARIISNRIKYFEKNKKEYREAKVIRDVMEDVEQIARYQAPKLLSCYNDLLKFFFISRGREDLIERIDDVGVYLELGVSIKTQISLISLGFSRTSAVLISEYIVSDSYDEFECADWLERNYQILDDLPVLVKLEIQTVVKGILY